MNEFVILITSACTLITLNYLALKVRNKMFIESNELFVVPILTGLSSVILILQPFPADSIIDLRFVPVIMAGLRFGLPTALFSIIIPVIYVISYGGIGSIAEIMLWLVIPAIISGLNHRKDYNNSYSPLQMIDGIKICIMFVLVRILFDHFVESTPYSEWIANNLLLFIVSCSATIILIAMYNNENKIWTIQRELELQANQDELTKLPNLRSFMNICSSTIKTRRISILMIDIDHFKNYNDQLGHQQGDQLLKELGHLLRQSIGAQDYLARYGGEEFIMMCPSYDLAKLNQLGQHLCNAVANYPFKGRQVQQNNQISISIGISIAKKVNDNITTMISEADHALYASKNGGRNQYSVVS